MKRLILFLYILSTFVFALAQNVQYDLIPFRKDTLWGYADISMTVLIQPQYDEIKFFKEDITAVRKNKKWGFIDIYGRPVTPFKYDLAGDFKEGMCQVKEDGNVGYINNKGKEVVKPDYEFGEEFSEGVAVVSDSIKGKLISNVIDKNGTVILSDITVSSFKFHSGCLAIREDNEDYFIHKNGSKLKLSEGVEIYFEFSEDAAIVKLKASGKLKDSFSSLYYLGIINSSGKLLKDTVKDVFGNKVSVSGTQRVISNFINGFALLERSSSMEIYDAYTNKKEYAFIDKNGKMSMWYNAVRAFSKDGRSLIVSSADSTVKTVNTKFKTIPPDIRLTDAGTFSEGLLRVKFSVNGKWGYINEEGAIVIDLVYDECSDFSGGVAAVTYAGKKGFINKNGRQFWVN